MKQCDLKKNNYGVIAYRKVCSCAPIFKFFYMNPQMFPLEANVYQKLPFSTIFGAVNPHFKSHNGESWRDCRNLSLPPYAKFCKNCLRGYTPLGEIYTTNYQCLPFCNFAISFTATDIRMLDNCVNRAFI